MRKMMVDHRPWSGHSPIAGDAARDPESTIHRAMKPAWGNPSLLKIRSISEKGGNLFVAEFSFQQDMERTLGGSPWMVGRHALILQQYDERLRPSEINFDRIEI